MWARKTSPPEKKNVKLTSKLAWLATTDNQMSRQTRLLSKNTQIFSDLFWRK